MFRKKKADPRPHCPECAQIVQPEKAAYIGTHYDIILRGVYCNSDCLLDAFVRGYPLKKYTR